jgi:uncharacterized membrane protein
MACVAATAKARYAGRMAVRLYMDRRLTPNRSLSRKGFYWLIGAIVAMNLAIAVFLVALHAFPVPIFLGLDVIGVLVAFRASYRSAGQAERVQVSADEVRVSHETPRSSRTVWTSPTAFTRVSVEGDDDARVRLRLSGKVLTIGHALGPRERVAFADELEDAIRQARAERY